MIFSLALKQNVAMAYPYTSGTAYTTYATLIQMLGLEKTLDWWEKFDQESIHQYTKSGTGCIPMAGLKEVGVGIAFSHDILAKVVNKGYPVVMTFPIRLLQKEPFLLVSILVIFYFLLIFMVYQTPCI